MTAAPGAGGDAAGNGAEKKKFFPKKFGGVGTYFCVGVNPVNVEAYKYSIGECVVKGLSWGAWGFSYPNFSATEKKNVPNSVKRKRINFRLRKVIVPKSPIMVLNEMVGAVNYTFVDTHPPMPNMPNQPPMQLFTAVCTVSFKFLNDLKLTRNCLLLEPTNLQVEGVNFQGTGPSKQIAKNICAEHCIQHIVTKRVAESKTKAAEAAKQFVKTDGSSDNGAAAAAGGGGGGLPEGLKPHEMTDETPWAQLASLALFKLFNDWQAQGFAIPAELFKPPDYFNNQGTAPPMKVKKVPPNWG